ncbi:hypothetical protein [Sphingomonas aracearum]|uniref:Uncharacterized protein n=1 Tax=Sphingomonas aracearum TaxID=2283317 RepID=A0A369VSP7_9SPHN|nr:hypothetical protein [Sphingomonas aracearum]RDE05426.1 hypothetical protein DVW87_09240 [Sphingomonas aracearum]
MSERKLPSIPPSDSIISSLEIGGVLGFAIPLESGQFKVVMFSLTGGLKATGRALELSPAGRKDDGKGLRAYTL